MMWEHFLDRTPGSSPYTRSYTPRSNLTSPPTYCTGMFLDGKRNPEHVKLHIDPGAVSRQYWLIFISFLSRVVSSRMIIRLPSGTTEAHLC